MRYKTLSELGPISYGDPLEEARRCRRDCALFDFSFMSRARISGDKALRSLHDIQSRDLSAMRVGDIRYCLYTDGFGDVSSDLTVWKISENSYDIYCGSQQDMDRIADHARTLCRYDDLSATTSVFSIQGPESLARLSLISNVNKLASLSYFQFDNIVVGGVSCLLGRLGYTGEKGFEIVVSDSQQATMIWNLLAGVCQPAGVAAIDILRIEAGFILFLNECRIGCNAIELGLSQFSGGSTPRCRYHLVCFRARENKLDLPWFPAVALSKPAEAEITITSATVSPLCNGILGMGFVQQMSRPGAVYKDPMERFHGIELVDIPFYDHQKRLPRSSW